MKMVRNFSKIETHLLTIIIIGIGKLMVLTVCILDDIGLDRYHLKFL